MSIIMATTECDIKFDHLNGVYNSGENVNGSIELRTTKTKIIKGISIQINGYAKTRWIDTVSRDSAHKDRVYERKEFSAYHQYINSVTFVVGSFGGEPFDLAPGTFNHLFTYSLPLTLPTSFEGQYGVIRYEIIVTIARPVKVDYIFKKCFTVIQPLNLNLDPTFKLPKHMQDWDMPVCCCCCCACGEITVDLKIPFGGYAPGQKLQYQMSVANNTEHDLGIPNVKLEMRITFECLKPYYTKRHINTEIYKKSFSPILRLLSKEYKDSIQLPSISPTTTDPEQLIRIEYLLTGEVETGCCANNIILAMPITIGTVPVIVSPPNPENAITQQPTAPTIDQNNEINNRIDSDLPPSYLTVASPSYEYSLSLALPSPSYEDSLPIAGDFEDAETDYKYNEIKFIPKYPVYYNFTGIPPPATLDRQYNFKQLPTYPQAINTSSLPTAPASDDEDDNILQNSDAVSTETAAALNSSSLTRTYGWDPS